METLLFTFPNDGRKLRQLITALLKKQLVVEVKRLNYVQSYTLEGTTIQKHDQKIVRIQFSSDKKQSVEGLLTKMYPERKTGLINSIGL